MKDAPGLLAEARMEQYHHDLETMCWRSLDLNIGGLLVEFGKYGEYTITIDPLVPVGEIHEVRRWQ